MGLNPVFSPYVLGIDLGTSTSSVAIYHKRMPEVIKIGGQKCIPSVVNVREDGTILVGEQAKRKMLVDPSNTVASIKREMGNSSFVKEFEGLPDRTFSPADISAEILVALRMAVEQTDQFDLRGTPKYAVICVPANFDDNKKTMTKEAGRLAGLEVLWLLEEPVAAAVAYGFEKDRNQTILVYDIGGGTFDVSILEVDTTSRDTAGFKVKAKEGIPKLGGDDFDEKIMEIVHEKFKADTGLDILDLKKDQGISAKLLREAQQKLKEAAEAAKLELSVSESAPIEIPNFITDENGSVHHINMVITRSDFENAIRDLILESKSAVDKALQSANMKIEDISRIVLVGGSTRVPLVKSMLTEMFDKEPFADLDPDTVVATGAGIFGASLKTPELPEGEVAEKDEDDVFDKRFIIDDIVTHNLGIEVFGRKFNRIIEKGTKLTDEQSVVSVEKLYSTPRDGATEIAINVFQAADDVEFVSDNRAVLIGEMLLIGIPPAPKGVPQISVRFEIDRQNILKVVASCQGADGVSKSLDIDIQR
ncbi:MAG: Hsp70 family protein [Desulfomonile sp.]